MTEQMKGIIALTGFVAMLGSAVGVGVVIGGQAAVPFGIMTFCLEWGMMLAIFQAVSEPTPAQKVAQFIGNWEVLRVQSEEGCAHVVLQGDSGRKFFVASYDTRLGCKAGLLNPGDRIEIRPREPGEYEYAGYLESYLDLVPAT